jgi:hypothetical protein
MRCVIGGGDFAAVRWIGSAVTGRPGAHHLAEDCEFPDVVGVVVADDAHAAEDGMARRPRNRLIQISRRIRGDRPQRGAIG